MTTVEQISTLQPKKDPMLVDVPSKKLQPAENPYWSSLLAGTAACGEEPMKEQVFLQDMLEVDTKRMCSQTFSGPESENIKGNGVVGYFLVNSDLPYKEEAAVLFCQEHGRMSQASVVLLATCGVDLDDQLLPSADIYCLQTREKAGWTTDETQTRCLIPEVAAVAYLRAEEIAKLEVYLQLATRNMTPNTRTGLRTI
ncbi:hypothetical protein llap_3694 [Limosa lapponica baueri]|uniref:Uncharacterized protein n=1 Tax=Limosa lapponica baueri TaxID=1758121 RepID=A0A2I0UIW7_LIMLA|nr:hypothetical protein llap_3694 [Limosa lapponica baueri]